MRPSFLFVMLVLLAACSEPAPQEARRDRAVKVLVEPVELSRERLKVEAVGTSEALQSVTLFSAAVGEVVKVGFRSGDYVEADSVLLLLDQRDQALAVSLAEVRVVDAERLFNRYQRSADSGATLPTVLDAARSELSAARIELDRSRIALEDRQVTAPFAGHVGITDIDIGDRVRTDTAIATLDNRRELLVSFDLPELLVGKINAGDQVSLTTWNMQSKSVTGDVIQLGSRIDPESRTFIVRARVENPGDSLRPGMSFRVQLDLAGDPYPVMPEIAVQWGAEGSFVWAVEDGHARQVPVNIIQRRKGQVLVETSLSVGQLIVVEGIQRLRPGVNVMTDTAVARDAKSGPGGGKRG
jgi:membrane fusion protein (multidrug efflux system)